MFARVAMLALLAVLATLPLSVAQIVASTQTTSVARREATANPALPVPPPRIAEGADYDRCLGMVSNDPQGASAFAESWASSGGGNGAIHCAALAQIQLGNVADGAEMLEKLANASRAPDLARAAVYGEAVRSWLMVNKPERAFDAATLALSLAPNDTDLLIDRAVAEISMEHYRDAIDDLDRAVAIEPRRAETFVLRASAWRHLNNVEVAANDVEHALAINPDSAEALLERGILRQRTGDRVGAREDWQRAINLDPNSSTADLAEQDLALLNAGPKQ